MIGHDTSRMLDSVRLQMQQALPGSVAHRMATPELAYGRHRGPRRQRHHLSAVLMLLTPTSDDWSLPLTLRPSHLVAHANQVSLPGGRLEPDEDAWTAACREFTEELGGDAKHFQLLGAMTPLYVFASRHWVMPFLAFSDQKQPYRPNPSEVAAVFDLSLSQLVATDFGDRRLQQRGLFLFESPGLSVEGHYVWGATAMMLAELRWIIQRAAQAGT